MPLTTRQLSRLMAVIERRFDLTESEKEEWLSALDDPLEAVEALEAGFFDLLFRRVTVSVSSTDGSQRWHLQVGPHAQIEAILDNIHIEDIVVLFQRFLNKANAGEFEFIHEKYLVTGTSDRGQIISFVIYIRDNETARVATTYIGRSKKRETGARIRV